MTIDSIQYSLKWDNALCIDGYDLESERMMAALVGVQNIPKASFFFLLCGEVIKKKEDLEILESMANKVIDFESGVMNNKKRGEIWTCLMAINEDQNTRRQALFGKKIWPLLAERFAYDESHRVRLQLAVRAYQISEKAQAVLLQGHDAVISRALASNTRNSTIAEKLLGEGYGDALSSNLNLPVKVGLKMTKSDQTYICQSLADRTKSKIILRALSKHPSSIIRQIVAKNIASGWRTRSVLGKDKEKAVRKAAYDTSVFLGEIIVFENGRPVMFGKEF